MSRSGVVSFPSLSLADRVAARLSRQRPWAQAQLISQPRATQPVVSLFSTRQRSSTCIRNWPALDNSLPTIADRVAARLSRPKPWTQSQLASQPRTTQPMANYSSARQRPSTCIRDRPVLRNSHSTRQRPLPEDLASTSTGGLSSPDASAIGSSALLSASSETVIGAKGNKSRILDLVQHLQHATGSAPHPAETVHVAEQVTESAPHLTKAVSVAKSKRADRRVRFAEDEEVRKVIGLGQHKLLAQHIWWSRKELKEIWADKYSQKVHFADDPVTEVIHCERWIDSVKAGNSAWENIKEGGFFDRFSGKLCGWSRVNDEDSAYIRSFGEQPILHEVGTMSKFQHRWIDPIPFSQAHIPIPMAILPEEFGASHFTIHGMQVPLVFGSGIVAKDIPSCIRTAKGMEMYLESGIPDQSGSLHPQGFIRAGKWFSGDPRTFYS